MSKEITSLEDWEKQLGVVATDEAIDEAAAGQSRYISLKGRQFALGNDNIGSEFDAVIAATLYENAYYDSPYDKDNFTAPACFAIQSDDGTMAPHDSSPDPQGDDDGLCNKCPMNEFGSALTGRGKACKNSRRLALIPYGEKGMSREDVAILRLPPTSLRHMSRYIKALARNEEIKRPMWSVVTRLSFDPNEEYPVVIPTYMAKITTLEDLQWLQGSQAAFKEAISEPYNVERYEKPAPRRRSKAS